MLAFTKVFFALYLVSSAFAVATNMVRDSAASLQVDASSKTPVFTVPTLTQIRDILGQIQPPIISALAERYKLGFNPELYANGAQPLRDFLKPRENVAKASGRYAYGKLEYPFIIPAVVKPDVTSKTNTFPPGRFHQDSYSGNPDLFAFYITTIVPLFTSPKPTFFHLDNSTVNNDAALNLDATILDLLSHRSSIGKVVAESKFAADVASFTSLIQARNTTQIRVLLTNTTQEATVLTGATNAASAFTTAWTSSGALDSPTYASDFSNIAFTTFRRLIDITTDIEVQYLLERFH
ncbi:chorismate mutase [Cristinia sonorae]|uniref:chorismate mutase n=1 Tax=Cristinia sonorae TaxID=1940300 RepID=A0A8K0UUV5_9AGAR|nr:chorismate mutase [Cristinia sonorae]